MVAEKNKWKLNRNGIVAVVGLVILIIVILYLSLRDGSEINYSLPTESTAEERAALETGTGTTAPLTQQRLAVFKAGSGEGTVVSYPPGINCGEECEQEYPNGTSVTLQATARSGSRLESWSGACAGVAGDRCTVTMNRARSVIVNFGSPVRENQPQVIVSKDGTGSGKVTSTPSGIDCSSDCTESYRNGTEVEFTATADPGSVFSGWHGACTGIGTCTVRVTGTTNLIATFSTTDTTYRLTVNRAGDGFGSIGSTPAGINCGNLDGDTDCTEDYRAGTSVTLNVLVGPGATFAGWSGDCAGVGSCTLIMSSARTATATFTSEIPNYDLSLIKSGSGSGTVTSSPAGVNCGDDCVETYSSGTSVTLSSISAAGSVLSGWTGCDENPAASICVVRMNAARTVKIIYNRLRTLRVIKEGDGTGKVESLPMGIECGATCAYDFADGQSILLRATEDFGSEFVSWTGCDSVSDDGFFCTIAINSDKTIYAKFNLLH